MPKTFTPPMAQNTVLAKNQVSAANTNRDGTGTIVDLYTAPTEGARISYIRAKATVTTTAGMVRIFIKNSGGTYRLIGEISIAAATPSATVQASEGEYYPTEPWLLLNGDVIGASTHNAEAINVFVFGSAFN